MQRLAPDQPVEQLAGQGDKQTNEPEAQLDSSFFLLPLALFGLVFVEGFLLAVSVSRLHADHQTVSHACQSS